MIFAEITALLVKGADKAMTIKDGIKIGIGFIIGREIAHTINNLIVTAGSNLLIHLRDKGEDDFVEDWNKVASVVDNSWVIEPKETKEPTKNVIGFSVN